MRRVGGEKVLKIKGAKGRFPWQKDVKEVQKKAGVKVSFS
jgi:hypothetical protein